jgi:SAM-dependent methyltransferase
MTKTNPCPACSGTSSKPYCPASFLYGDKRDILECSTCGLSVLWPLPTGKELSSYYHEGYFNFEKNKEEGRGWAFGQELAAWKDRGRFLDLGCATGFFLNGVKQGSGWEVFGLETGSGAAKYAREKLGLNVKSVLLEKAGYAKGFFDAIRVNNVLEHVLDPAKTLRDVSHILKPGGRLFLTLPNGRVDRAHYSGFHKAFGERGASKDGHLYFFSPKSLDLLAERSGFTIESSYGTELKRALRVLGCWPKKSDWAKPFQKRVKARRSVEESVVEGRKKPRAYYLLQRKLEGLTLLRGFSPWAYDYTILLSKKP